MTQPRGKFRRAARCRSLSVLAVLGALTCYLPGAVSAQQIPPAAPGLSLGAATAAALATNPTTSAGAQQLAQSQARVAQAEAQRRLQITFNSAVSGSDARVIQPPPGHETFGTLLNTLTVPLPLGARPRLAVTQSREQLAAALAQYAAARLSLVGQVNAAYYDLLRKQALLSVALDTQAQAQRQLTEARRRNRAGDVPELDVQRAQVPVASAEAGLYQSQNSVAVARQALNALIGQPLDAPLAVNDVAPAFGALPYSLEQARALALANSPDVRAAEATIRADEAALQSARLSREPTFVLQASDTRSNDQTSFSRLDTVQASVTVPLSDGGLARAQVQEAQSALAQAQAQAQAARRSALVTVSSAYLTALSSRQQVSAARVAQNIAGTTYEKTLRGYQNGLFPLSDVLNAQTALSQTRTAYAQAVYDAAVAAGILQNATGKGRPVKERYLFALLAASGCVWAAGCGHKSKQAADAGPDKDAPAPTVQAAAVRVGPIEQTLPVTGTLTALRTGQATVTPPVAGVLDALPVRTGQTVQKGQIVAHLSTRLLSGQIQQAQATIAQNRVQVEQAQAAAIQQEAQTQTAIAQAEAAVSGARATLAGAEATLTGNEAALHNAQQSLARVQTLYGDGLVAQKDVEAAQLAVQTAAAQAAAQRQAVGAQRETVRSQRLSFAAAQTARLQNLLKRKDVQIAQQQVRNAQGALATARAQMALYTLRAPLSGTVTGIGASLGETVDTSVKLVSVVNLDTLQLQIAVPADAAHRVHVGQPLTFRVENVPGKVFHSAVRGLTAQVEPASNTVPALAVIPNPRHELTNGAFARVQIVTQSRPAALLVPKSAVLRDAGGQVTVAVIGADGVAHIREVKTGLAEADDVEILSGVKSGERVVTTGSYGLPDGTKVTAAEGKTAP